MEKYLSKNVGTIQFFLLSILWLFFFQLVSEFVEAIYAFGLMGTGIPVEIAFVGYFLLPFLFLILKRPLGRWALLLIGEAIVIIRAGLPLLNTRGRLMVAGLGVFLFFVFIPSFFLQMKDKKTGSEYAKKFSASLMVSVLLSVLFRSLGRGYDISLHGGTQWIGAFLALVAGISLFVTAGVTNEATSQEEEKSALSWGKTILLGIGLIGSLLLLSFAFTAPYVMARWTGENHERIVIFQALVFASFALIAGLRPQWIKNIKQWGLLLWNALFTVALTATMLLNGEMFSKNENAYPFTARPQSSFQAIALYATILFAPVLFVNVMRMVKTLSTRRPTPRALMAGVSFGSLYFLIMVLAHAFTSVYDYMPLVGPFFRDKYWLIHLVAALVVALPFVLIKKNGQGESEKQEALEEPRNSLRPLVLLALSLAIVVTAALVPPIKAAPQSAGFLNILTYNIQHGYNDAGEKGFKEQLERIRELDPDILGLQESDVAKMGTGNADLVKYFASGLNMHAYYGPKTVNGTFGIALLSKYPIEDAKTHYMYSIGEQTATIEAKIAVGEQVFNVFVTHLGNKGPIFQQENVLEMVQNRENVILMGDMNFRPPTEQYQITTAVMDDAWLVRWPGGNEDQGIDPERRIDHIFVRLNGGIEVAEATYLPGPESDHPAMMAVLSW